MYWASQVVVVLAATLVAANAQCMIDCSFEHCGSAEAPASPCRHKSNSDRGQPVNTPCSHDVSIAGTSAKIITAPPALELVAIGSVAPIAEAPQLSGQTQILDDIPPPVPVLSSISVLLI
jgi:hypothetical protein